MAYRVLARQLPPYGLIDLRADPSAQAAFMEVLGIALPTTANTVASGQTGDLLWLGPDQWLLKTAAQEEERLEDLLRQALADAHGAVTIVSDHYKVFRLQGEDIRAVLAQGCGIDLHPAAFGIGQCVRCKFARTQVILLPIDNCCFELYAESSYTYYLQQWFAQTIGPG